MTTLQIPLWKKILRSNFTRLEDLSTFLNVPLEHLLNRRQFPLNVPRRLASKMEKGNTKDPLFLQFVPTVSEQRPSEGFILDPVADASFRCSDRMLQKYSGRVLFVTTGACAMHCRYCFRQNFDYPAGERSFEKEYRAIEEDTSIREVILSGGDPLSLSDTILQGVLERLQNIPHIQAIRFHTRFPVGIPERIDDSFLNLLKSVRTQIWLVLHVNHPAELDEDIFAALKKIQMLGIPVLNQSVLLKGVNDSVEVQVALCKSLVDHGIIPYYLHQLDKVQGAAHFEVPIEEGKRIVQEMTAQLPGYAVPRYVQEIPHAPSKTPL